MAIEIRLAETAAERARVAEIRHAANASELPCAWYVARRLAAARPNRGAWWLLEEDGLAVSTATVYGLRLGRGAGTWPAFGIGGVATLPSHRGRGHASRLCRELAERREAAGAALGLLFSAIAPAFYEALGYRVAPAASHTFRRLDALAASGPQAALRPLDPFTEREHLQRLHDQLHPGLRIARDAAAWARSLADGPDDLFFATPRGYARLTDEGDELDLAELLPHDDDDALRAVAALALALGKRALTSWLPPTPLRAELGEAESRATTLPMVRGEVDLTDALLWGSDYF